jgi:hypothetical protein
MVALLTPFAATSNGFIFPHIRCLFLLHLISEKIWLLLRSFVSLAPEQRHFQWPSNIAVIVTITIVHCEFNSIRCIAAFLVF